MATIKGFYYPHHLEPYAMLDEVLMHVHNALQEVKRLQVEHGNGNVLLWIKKALGSTIAETAQGGSSIMQAIGGAIQNILEDLVRCYFQGDYVDWSYNLRYRKRH